MNSDNGSPGNPGTEPMPLNKKTSPFIRAIFKLRQCFRCYQSPFKLSSDHWAPPSWTTSWTNPTYSYTLLLESPIAVCEQHNRAPVMSKPMEELTPFRLFQRVRSTVQRCNSIGPSHLQSYSEIPRWGWIGFFNANVPKRSLVETNKLCQKRIDRFASQSNMPRTISQYPVKRTWEYLMFINHYPYIF